MTERDGRPVEHPITEFREVIEEEGDTGLTTPEVAAAVGCSESLARKRLTELFEGDEIGRREVGQYYLWSSK